MDAEATAPERGHREIMMPERWKAKVWRYVSFASLVSILQSGKVFFPRITKLDDPYEGAMPDALRSYFGNEEEEFEGRKLRVVDFLEAHSRFSCVSCWHVNEVESAAMWKLYSSDSGVAVQSTVGGLILGFKEANPKMALVQYIDLEGSDLPKLMFPVYLKRKSFSHENELRVTLIETDIPAYPDGLPVAADLKALIECIYVSPSAPKWHVDVVRWEVERHGLKVEVHQSSLYSKALK